MRYRSVLLSLLLCAVVTPDIAPAQYTIKTVAGGGPPDGVPAVDVGFIPSSVAVDPSGALHIVSNYRIYKVSSGLVYTVAGNGSLGYAGSAASTSSLWNVLGIVFDKAGNLYASDTNNYQVLR